MSKIDVGIQGFTLPMPQTILSTKCEGRINHMALAWVSRVNYSPALIMISVGRKHLSNKMIAESKEFCVNIPSVKMVEATDFVGLVSGNKVSKDEYFEIEKGTLENAPIISDCPVSIECKVFDSMELPNDTLFVGEIVSTWCDESTLIDGKVPDIKKVDPFTLSMPDNHYWSVGECVGRAWHEGKKLK